MKTISIVFDVIKRQAVTKENWDKIQKKLQKHGERKRRHFPEYTTGKRYKAKLKEKL